MNPITLLSGQRGFLLPICWVLGTAVLISAWWFGRRVVPSTRWALVTVGLWFLPVLPFLPLGSADVYSYACQGYVQHAGGDPYAAGVGEFGCPWLGSVASSWVDSPAPYGPLFLVLAAGAVGVAGDSLAGVIAGLRVIALGGLALTAMGLPVLARRAGVDPARAVWVVLGCPLVLIHLVSGAHNDALMIGLIVAGLALVVSRPSPGWLVAAGAVLGLAVAVKATAVVVLPFAVLIAAVPSRSRERAASSLPPDPTAALRPSDQTAALRPSDPAAALRPSDPAAALRPSDPAAALRPSGLAATSRPPRQDASGSVGGRGWISQLWRPAVALGGGLALATGVLSVVSGRGFGWVAGLLRSGDSVTWGSPSTAVGLSVNFVAGLFGGHIDAVPVTRAIGVVLLAVILVGLWWRARRGGALPGAGLALAATVLCAPVFHPWYATWPLAVLAATWPERPARTGPLTQSGAGSVGDDGLDGTPAGGSARIRWLLGLCAFASTLTLPAGYNWALYTRIPGALVVTAGLIVLAVMIGRRFSTRKVAV